VPHVADDAHHLPLFPPVQRNLAHGITIRPEPLGHRLVDHHHLLTFGGVVCGELPASAQQDLHCANISGVD
jgi:hypothetical protein